MKAGIILTESLGLRYLGHEKGVMGNPNVIGLKETMVDLLQNFTAKYELSTEEILMKCSYLPAVYL